MTYTTYQVTTPIKIVPLNKLIIMDATLYNIIISDGPFSSYYSVSGTIKLFDKNAEKFHKLVKDSWSISSTIPKFMLTDLKFNCYINNIIIDRIEINNNNHTIEVEFDARCNINDITMVLDHCVNSHMTN